MIDWPDFIDPDDDQQRVLTIGAFDGVHRGHQLLLRATVERARELGLRSMAVTFEPLPSMVIRPDKFHGRLCSREEKAERLRQSGIDDLVTLEFSRDLSDLTAEEFMDQLVRTVHPREIWVGEAFALGKNRAGDVNRLRAIGDRLGYHLNALQRLTDDGTVLSSSGIRRALMAGDVDLARRYLGRPFRVTGPVIHGAHLGRTIGYPTANVPPSPDLVQLADGIYASEAWLPGDDSARTAMTYIGTRPTINTGARIIETHIFDFDGDLYGREIGVDFFSRLREDQTFPDLDSLVAQLRRDERNVRAYFRNHGVEAASYGETGD